MPEPKFCVDCQYADRVRSYVSPVGWTGDLKLFPEGICHHPSAVRGPDPVTGEKRRWSMYDLREPALIGPDVCGPEGRWWEPLPPRHQNAAGLDPDGAPLQSLCAVIEACGPRSHP